MGEVSFTIPGRVAGKGRPRFVRATGRTYTPEKTASAEAMVRTLASDAMNGAGLIEGPVKLTVTAEYSIPKSWSRSKRAAATWVTGRPDADNVCKTISDAMNGIVYRDDAQISILVFSRQYVEGAESVEVSVSPLFEKAGAA